MTINGCAFSDGKIDRYRCPKQKGVCVLMKFLTLTCPGDVEGGSRNRQKSDMCYGSRIIHEHLPMPMCCENSWINATASSSGMFARSAPPVHGCGCRTKLTNHFGRTLPMRLGVSQKHHHRLHKQRPDIT